MTQKPNALTQASNLRVLLFVATLTFLAVPARAMSASFVSLYNLVGNCDATLVQSTNSLLFGTTLTGGPAGGGSIFAASPTVSRFITGSFTNLHSFATSDGGE